MSPSDAQPPAILTGLAPSTLNQLRTCGIVLVAAPLLLLGGLCLAWIVIGPAYPRNKRAAFDDLSAAGVQAVVDQGRRLIRDEDAPGPWPPAIQALRPLEVSTSTPPASYLWIRLGGDSFVGSYGFVVLPPGEPVPDGLRTTKVADGLYFSDAYDAPAHMCGLPEGWSAGR